MKKLKTFFKSPLVDALIDCWALLLGMGLVMLGNGLQGPLLGVRALMEGFSPSLTGVVMSTYFIGFVFGAKFAPVLVMRVGHVRVFAALASIVSASALLHAVYLLPIAWILMRFVTGACFSGLYIVAESWLNESISNATRGKLLSAYMVVNLGGMGSGPMLLSMGDPAGSNLFIIVSILFSISLVPILMTVGPMPAFETHRTMRLSQIIKDAPLGVVGCFITGVSNGAIIGLGAVYAEILGFTITQVSLFMSSAILGGVFFQWPVGHASDIFDRRIVLTAVTFIASIAAAFTFAVKPGNILSYSALIGVIGGMSFPMYSLVLAMVNDRLTTDQMVAASSSLVLIVGIGAFLGAGAAGEAIDRMGAPGFMVLLSVIHASLGVFALYRMLIVPTVPLEQQGPSVYIPRTSPVAAAVAFEDTQEQTDEITGDQDSQ